MCVVWPSWRHLIRHPPLAGLVHVSITCLNIGMAQGQPMIWSCIPLQCRLGHPWRPGTVTISWDPCECGPAQAARGGHVRVTCGAPRCSEVWCAPLHKPIGVIGHHRPGYR